MEYKFDPKDIRGLEQAIRRNPKVVQREISTFITQGIAIINRGIIRNPWRIGMSGGGAPVDTGNLRDTHGRNVSPVSAEIFPTASYAEAVHKKRPWLDYVFETSKPQFEALQIKLLENVVGDLAR